jgi:hypothetical protein
MLKHSPLQSAANHVSIPCGRRCLSKKEEEGDVFRALPLATLACVRFTPHPCGPHHVNSSNRLSPKAHSSLSLAKNKRFSTFSPTTPRRKNTSPRPVEKTPASQAVRSRAAPSAASPPRRFAPPSPSSSRARQLQVERAAAYPALLACFPGLSRPPALKLSNSEFPDASSSPLVVGVESSPAPSLPTGVNRTHETSRRCQPRQASELKAQSTDGISLLGQDRRQCPALY